MASPPGGRRKLTERPSGRTPSYGSDSSHVPSSILSTPHAQRQFLSNVAEEPGGSQQTTDELGSSPRSVKGTAAYQGEYILRPAMLPFKNPAQTSDATITELESMVQEIAELKRVLGSAAQEQTGPVTSEEDIDLFFSDGNKPVAQQLLAARMNAELETDLVRIKTELALARKQANKEDRQNANQIEQLQADKSFLQEQITKAKKWQGKAMSMVEDLRVEKHVLGDEVLRLNAVLRAKGVDPHAGEAGAAAKQRLLDVLDPQP